MVFLEKKKRNEEKFCVQKSGKNREENYLRYIWELEFIFLY